MTTPTVIFESSFLHHIYLMKHLLEQRGIAAVTRNENVMTSIGSSVSEPYKLVVDSADVESAQTIVREEQKALQGL